MATLILTAVGTAVGGPFGGALGALVGQAVDSRVFRAKGREGPRLIELAVQTSSYGAPIAQLFGTMRVAGSVIWSTDLIERASTSGGGKGGPRTTNYSYSASFAVLLSARPIRGVRRIWADGKLLRGAAGDFKSDTRFRLHSGDEAQAADPLIASAEGAATPAHRGCAYAVFEDMALADFGNRIPSLTFEVEADAAPVTCGFIADAVSGGRVAGGGAAALLGGYSAYGETLRAVVDGLASASGAWLAPAAGGLELRAGPGPATTLPDAGVGGARGHRAIAAADTAPRILSIRHHDPARDYQAGLQRAARPGAGTRAVHVELPAAIDADAAKTMAGAMLTRADVERERRSIALDWRSLAVTPGDRVTIAGEGGLWRVAGWAFEHMVVTLDLVRIARAPVQARATPGRAVSSPDVTAERTILHAFEMPPADDRLLSAPRLTVAAAGTGAGWRSAAVQISTDGGVQWSVAGAIRAPATLGHVERAPGAAGSRLIDRHGIVEVTLAHAAMTLADADMRALDGGANLAIVGDELLQFGRAERIGGARWRLRDLWRGRHGTEAAAGAATMGDRFVLLEPAALLAIDLPASVTGTSVSVMASGVGDGDTPALAVAQMTGASIVPPAPVALSARVEGDDLTLGWTRRSRAGWRWIDGVDAPLAEEAERYRATLHNAEGGVIATVETAVPQASFAAALIPGGAVAAEVRQIGSFGPSPPARIPFT